MVRKGDIGYHIAPRVGLVPDDGSTRAHNGVGIDRLAIGANSCELVVMMGAVDDTGVSVQTMDVKIQDSADDITYADYTDAAGNGAVTTVTAESTAVGEAIDLRAANQYVRAVGTLSLTGGTAPTWPNCALIIFGGFDVEPTA